ncbi:MAG: DUF4424 domain-containing protein, partial [Actinobacteria bacterium]
MKRTTLALLACCLALAVAAPAALANDGAVGTQGGTVRPIGNADVRMDSEAVQIICMDGVALYRIDFKFVNEASEPKTVKLGFPFPDFENTEYDNNGEAPGGFRAWLNGRELAVAQEKGTDGEGDDTWDVIWFTHTATFPPGDSMITVSYVGSPDVSVGVPDQLAGVAIPAGVAPESIGMGYYPYFVHTGAGWAGTIGKSVIRYTLADDFDGFGVEQVTKNWVNGSREWMGAERAKNLLAFTKPEPNVYQWTYTDYEPTRAHDPEIAFARSSAWREDFDPWEETKASTYLKLGDFEYVPYNAANGNPGDAWAEAVDGPGIGQWLQVPFGETRAVKQIRVLGGYQKRADLYAKYNRPKRLKIDYSDGSSQEITLADEMGLQVFDANASATSAKVTILDVYKGTNERDETYLSEIAFAEAPAPQFEKFEAVTGIAPPTGFEEPEGLAALTKGAGGTASGEGGEAWL